MHIHILKIYIVQSHLLAAYATLYMHILYLAAQRLLSCRPQWTRTCKQYYYIFTLQPSHFCVFGHVTACLSSIYRVKYVDMHRFATVLERIGMQKRDWLDESIVSEVLRSKVFNHTIYVSLSN